MKRTTLADRPCPIARCLDVVGEWWTLLIVRDALFGSRRYEQFREIGMADNVLTARLKRLVEEGVMMRHRYQQRPDRYEYLLTEKGNALGTVIGALRDWGRQWTEGEDLSPRVVHAECGHEAGVEVRCPHCDRAVAMSELRPLPAGAQSVR